ncbi:MAG TPA: hypothetical protein VJH22_00295 [Candidatus Nanoarchaeia archaeon]|nr:hypothetical protein [Candidatus Nanoarchaeia archaeon]
MRNAVHHCIHCLLHHSVVALILIVLVYGLQAGWLIDRSGSFLTGTAVAQETLTGRLILNADLSPYAQILETQEVFVTQVPQPPGGQVLVSGYAQDVMPALLKAAKLAQSHGHLVSYNTIE